MNAQDYIDSHFLNVPLHRNTMDIYLVRTTILSHLRKALPSLHGRVLDVGCGVMPYKSLLLNSGKKINEYLGMDLADNRSYNNQPDIKWDGVNIPLEDESVDCVLLTEVLEHCSEPNQTLAEIRRVLKPGGIIFITVPFFWMLHEAPYDEYRYTPFALRRHVESSGFTIDELKALGGWNASMAQFVANWIFYSDSSQRTRRMVKFLFFPIYKYLIKKDKVPVNFATGQMITGLVCIARKK